MGLLVKNNIRIFSYLIFEPHVADACNKFIFWRILRRMNIKILSDSHKMPAITSVLFIFA